ncbi:hypothetical protein C8J57DRAFT_1095682 [Mycena rebaudengoi]|nr:hypothetical protein C8J57DRAFT_1095682 [Mycena rebaudengoi]
MGFLLQPPPKLLCDHGSTPCEFRTPPLDGHMTIPEILEWHSANNPGHSLFVHTTQDGLKYVTYQDFSPAMHRAGRYVASLCGLPLCGPAPAVIAILATSDTMTTLTTMMGMVRAGLVVFPLSPRFSPDVLGHLLATKLVQHVLVSTEPHIKQLAKNACAVARQLSPSVTPNLHPMPNFEDLYLSTTEVPSIPPRVTDISSVSFIVHSSASTSQYPKAVQWTLRHNLQNSMASLFGKDPLCGQILGCHGIEPFHTLGLLLFFCAVQIFSSSAHFGLTYLDSPPLDIHWRYSNQKHLLWFQLRRLSSKGTATLIQPTR